jgi:hypothetical protein
MGAASLVIEAEATPEAIADVLGGWLADEPRRVRAGVALAGWDMPDATATITDLVLGATR